MIQALISPVASLASTWLEGRVAKTKAAAQATVAEAESRAAIAQKVAAGDIDWEKAAIQATESSWKDELALIVLLAPAVGVYFWPERVQAGFDVLNTLPEWYTWLLFIGVSSSFGIRGVGQAAKMLGKRK